MENPCQIFRSRRKSISIQITKEAELIVRAPHSVPEKLIHEFLLKKQGWIEKKKRLMRAIKRSVISQKMIDVAACKKRAHFIIEERIKYYSSQYGFQFKGFRITAAKSRFGSCTASGNLNFSWRLVLFPPEVIDYVIIHELTHLIEFNHSKRFWDRVGQLIPDYKRHKKWLKENNPLCD